MQYFQVLGLAAALLMTGGFATSLFLDVTSSSGIDFQFEAGRTPAKYLIEAMGRGVAVLDADRDGRLDIVFVNGAAGMADKTPKRFWNRLYRNRGDGTFTDITERAGLQGKGYGQGVATGDCDCDSDGRTDLYVTSFGGNTLYRNQGGGVFEDVTGRSGTAGSGTAGDGWSSSAGFVDFDRDGWPDIQQPFRNRHNGTFEEVALGAGLAYDEDGRVFAGMGIDVADYDNDGWPDAFVNALANQGYGLFHNSKGLFAHRSVATGLTAVSKMHSGWGAKFIDYDNDGWRDLFVAQGHVMDNIELTQPGLRYRERLLLARNLDGKSFADVSATAGAPFHNAMAGRGAAFGDLESDGATDIVVSAVDGKARVLRNQGAGNHWLTVNTIGTKSNRDGIGASVRIVTALGAEQFGYVSTAGSYLSANDSGIAQSWKNVAADQVFNAKEEAP